MANETKHLSAAGWASLRAREGAIFHYYNDSARNCTYGVGTLAHLGPCTEEEMRRPVTPEEVNAQLSIRVHSTEAAVRRQVPDRELTQEQFDALVSFTYNAGATGAHPTMAAANGGRDAEVAQQMAQHVYVHPRDAHGRRLAPVRSTGLVIRRREEAVPFLNQAGTQ